MSENIDRQYQALPAQKNLQLSNGEMVLGKNALIKYTVYKSKRTLTNEDILSYSPASQACTTLFSKANPSNLKHRA